MTRALWSIYPSNSIYHSISLSLSSHPPLIQPALLCRTDQLMCLLVYSFLLPLSFFPSYFSSYSSSDDFLMHLSCIILLPYERKVCVDWVCVCMCMCMYVVSRGTSCCVCNFLFVHGPEHLWPLQSRGEMFRETERLNKTKKDWEKRKERGERGKTGW